MTVEEMLDDLPSMRPDMEELQALFSGKDMQHNLYGVHIPAADSYPEPEPAHWHCTCSACGQVFAVPDNRRLKDITVCPKCGAAVAPHRWTVPQRGKRINAFLFYHLFRGQGRSIWVRSWHVSQWLTAEGAEIDYEPQSIYYFHDNVCQKWRLGWKGWKEIKTIKDDVWYTTQMCRATYPSFVGRIDLQTLKGSCLEYSQLDRALTYCLPVIAYLRLYIKYPAVEYLWKARCDRLLVDHLCYRDGYFRKAVNLRAKDFKGLFRGADKAEMKVIPQLHADEVYWFHRLYQMGVIRANQEGVDWTRARMGFSQEVPVQEEAVLYRYIKRQANRSGLAYKNILSDYRDYLNQLAEIGGGERYPHDLQQAHRRLSARLRKIKNPNLQGLFRARRRLWSWAAWQSQGMFIRVIDSVEEITLEGERQDNCVAGYAARHAQGKTVIFVLRKKSEPKENWHTVELNPQTLHVKQCRGYRNADALPEAEAFIEAWVKRLQEIRKERKKSA